MYSNTIDKKVHTNAFLSSGRRPQYLALQLDLKNFSGNESFRALGRLLLGGRKVASPWSSSRKMAMDSRAPSMSLQLSRSRSPVWRCVVRP